MPVSDSLTVVFTDSDWNFDLGTVNGNQFSNIELFNDQDIGVKTLTTSANGVVFTGENRLQIASQNVDYQFIGSELVLNTPNAAVTSSDGVTVTTDVLDIDATTIDIDTNVDEFISTTSGNTTVVEVDDILVSSMVAGNSILDITAGGDITIANAATGSNSTGTVDVFSEGSILFEGDLTSAQITAGDINLTSIFEIGSAISPLVADYLNQATLISGVVFQPRLINLNSPLPIIEGIITDSIANSAVSSGVLSSTQDILGDLVTVDPALFTDITSYSAEETSVGLPCDVAEDGEECEI